VKEKILCKGEKTENYTNKNCKKGQNLNEWHRENKQQRGPTEEIQSLDQFTWSLSEAKSHNRLLPFTGFNLVSDKDISDILDFLIPTLACYHCASKAVVPRLVPTVMPCSGKKKCHLF